MATKRKQREKKNGHDACCAIANRSGRSNAIEQGFCSCLFETTHFIYHIQARIPVMVLIRVVINRRIYL